MPLEKFFESFAGAIRYVRYAPGIQVVLARNVLFALFISVIPALLPVVALKEVHIGSSDLGLLFTSMGVGSVLGAIVLIPRARARFSPNTLTILASVLLAIVFLLTSVVRDVHFYLGVSALAGVAWTMAASELWVAGQQAMPPWARGRMNATHMMLSQGGMALGGLVWGGAAASLGVRFTLMAAAVLLLSSLALAFPLSIDFTGSLNFDPALPRREYHTMLNIPEPDDGPVTITYNFHIDAVNRERFMELMREVRLVHLRNGAFTWRLDEDLAECHVFRVEMLVASWSEHLLQHERITREEQRNLERAWSIDVRPDGPVVKHFISVNKELLGGKRQSPCPPPLRATATRSSSKMPEKKAWFRPKFWFRVRILEATRICDYFRSDFSNRTDFWNAFEFPDLTAEEIMHVAGIRFSVSGNAFRNDRWNALRFLLLKEHPL